HFSAGASFTDASFLAEGPLGGGGSAKPKGSWLVAVRKSYVQYLIARSNAPNAAVFNLEDLQARLAYDLTARNALTFAVLESYSAVNQSSDTAGLGLNSVAQGGYHYTLGNLGWRYTKGSGLILNSHVAWMRERYSNRTPADSPLFGGYYGEWV